MKDGLLSIIRTKVIRTSNSLYFGIKSQEVEGLLKKTLWNSRYVNSTTI